MGWKRLEKEFKKAGKSIENEYKRVSESASNELTRCVERSVVKTLGSVSSENVESAVTVPTPHVIKSEENNVPSVEVATSEDLFVNLEGLEPGRAYIINHVTFNDPQLNERKGSELDVERLRTIFRQFHMKVKRVHDGTLADIKAVMEKISVFDFRNSACLVIVIMSHGHESNIIAAKDGEYSLDHDIMYPILQNRSLTSKLKLLVVQACKGPVNPLLEIEGPRKRPTAIPSEILQITSCVEGYVSYLDPNHGSIFIKTLCEHLEKSGMKQSVLDLANAVVADVKQKLSDIQIPMVHTNLTKKFVFGHYVKDCFTPIDDASSEEE